MTAAKPYTRLKLACYTTNVSMSVVGNLSPILFLTFHNLYDISYSLLGLLILYNIIRICKVQYILVLQILYRCIYYLLLLV